MPADHPDKAREIGSEATPADFLDTMLDVVEALDRVLAPHGSICFELGDTYSGSGGGGGDYLPGGMREGQQVFGGSADRARHDESCDMGEDCRCYDLMRESNAAHWRQKNQQKAAWPLPKSLCGIPTLFAWSLAYGRNLLRPERETDRWRIRNLVVWARPNPPVGALGDKWRPSTSFVVVATKNPKRWFDLDAVRTEFRGVNAERQAGGWNNVSAKYDRNQTDGPGRDEHSPYGHPAGAPPLDHIVLPPGGYKGSHYAVFPAELPGPFINSMCPRRVCVTCGEPSRRITEAFTLDSYRASDRPQTIKAVALADEHGLTDQHIAAVRAFGTSDAGKAPMLNNGAGKNTDEVKRLAGEAKAVLGGYFREFVMSTNAERESTWSDWRTGVVLDPFAGSGTTLAVATGMGREAIGIDLDERNLDLVRERVGMFLEEDLPRPVEVVEARGKL